MKRILAITAVCLVALGASGQALDIRHIYRTNDLTQRPVRDEISWHQGETVTIDAWVMRRTNAVAIPTNTVPVFYVVDNSLTNYYVTWTGTWVSATGGHYTVEIPSDYTAITAGFYNAMTVGYNGDQRGVLDSPDLRVKWSADYLGAYRGPTTFTNAVLDGDTYVAPGFWALYATDILSALNLSSQGVQSVVSTSAYLTVANGSGPAVALQLDYAGIRSGLAPLSGASFSGPVTASVFHLQSGVKIESSGTTNILINGARVVFPGELASIDTAAKQLVSSNAPGRPFIFSDANNLVIKPRSTADAEGTDSGNITIAGGSGVGEDGFLSERNRIIIGSKTNYTGSPSAISFIIDDTVLEEDVTTPGDFLFDWDMSFGNHTEGVFRVDGRFDLYPTGAVLRVPLYVGSNLVYHAGNLPASGSASPTAADKGSNNTYSAGTTQDMPTLRVGNIGLTMSTAPHNIAPSSWTNLAAGGRGNIILYPGLSEANANTIQAGSGNFVLADAFFYGAGAGMEQPQNVAMNTSNVTDNVILKSRNVTLNNSAHDNQIFGNTAVMTLTGSSDVHTRATKLQSIFGTTAYSIIDGLLDSGGTYTDGGNSYGHGASGIGKGVLSSQGWVWLLSSRNFASTGSTLRTSSMIATEDCAIFGVSNSVVMAGWRIRQQGANSLLTGVTAGNNASNAVVHSLGVSRPFTNLLPSVMVVSADNGIVMPVLAASPSNPPPGWASFYFMTNSGAGKVEFLCRFDDGSVRTNSWR